MGVTINPLRKVNGKVGKTAKELIKKWKQLLPTDSAPTTTVNHKVIEKEQFKNSRKAVERGRGKLSTDINCTSSSTSSKNTLNDKHDYRSHPLPVLPSLPSSSGQSSKLHGNKITVPTNSELSQEPDSIAEISRKRRRNILKSLSISSMIMDMHVHHNSPLSTLYLHLLG